MANRSKSPRPAALRGAANALKSRALNFAQGWLHFGPPIAVIDIGSNSVRLVIYEGLTRAPTPIFNEKVLVMFLSVSTRGSCRRRALAAGRRIGSPTW